MRSRFGVVVSELWAGPDQDTDNASHNLSHSPARKPARPLALGTSLTCVFRTNMTGDSVPIYVRSEVWRCCVENSTGRPHLDGFCPQEPDVQTSNFSTHDQRRYTPEVAGRPLARAERIHPQHLQRGRDCCCRLKTEPAQIWIGDDNLLSNTQGRSPVRELRTLDSVCWALSNGRLYRDCMPSWHQHAVRYLQKWGGYQLAA